MAERDMLIRFVAGIVALWDENATLTARKATELYMIGQGLRRATWATLSDRQRSRLATMAKKARQIAKEEACSG